MNAKASKIFLELQTNLCVTFEHYSYNKGLQGFECVNSEICEQFNAFIQFIKSSARQMSQEHFCFYLQFFLDIWNERKEEKFQKHLRVARAGIVN